MISLNVNTPAIVQPEYEGFSNRETWYVCFQLKNIYDLYSKYTVLLQTKKTTNAKINALQKFVYNNKHNFIEAQGIDFDLVNWEELLSELLHSL